MQRKTGKQTLFIDILPERTTSICQQIKSHEMDIAFYSHLSPAICRAAAGLHGYGEIVPDTGLDAN